MLPWLLSEGAYKLAALPPLVHHAARRRVGVVAALCARAAARADAAHRCAHVPRRRRSAGSGPRRGVPAGGLQQLGWTDNKRATETRLRGLGWEDSTPGDREQALHLRYSDN